MSTAATTPGLLSGELMAIAAVPAGALRRPAEPFASVRRRWSSLRNPHIKRSTSGRRPGAGAVPASRLAYWPGVAEDGPSEIHLRTGPLR